jgi:hypothetical protein
MTVLADTTRFTSMATSFLRITPCSLLPEYNLPLFEKGDCRPLCKPANRATAGSVHLHNAE